MPMRASRRAGAVWAGASVVPVVLTAVGGALPAEGLVSVAVPGSGAVVAVVDRLGRIRSSKTASRRSSRAKPSRAADARRNERTGSTTVSTRMTATVTRAAITLSVHSRKQESGLSAQPSRPSASAAGDSGQTGAGAAA